MNDKNNFLTLDNCTSKEVSPRSHVFTFTRPYELTNKNVKLMFLVMSDEHSDSIHHMKEQRIKHLEFARKNNIAIFSIGDLFDAMQSKHDPRASYSGLDTEYKVDAYLNSLPKKWLKKNKDYLDYYRLIGYGNHETGVIKNKNFDLIESITDNMPNTYKGSYDGHITIKIQNKDKSGSQIFKIHYFHGKGGNSPVTHGIISQNRTLQRVQGADLYIQGHLHTPLMLPFESEYVNNAGQIVNKSSYYIQMPSYHGYNVDARTGFVIENGFNRKPTGCCLATLTAGTNSIKADYRFLLD